MGSTFGNIQVHVGERDRQQVAATVVKALRQWMLGEDYIEVPDADAAGEYYRRRIILVGPVGPEASASWLTVFDGAIDGSVPPRELLNRLSTAVGGDVLGITLVDSDALRLDLHRHGQPVDTYDSYPDYLDNPGRKS